MEGLMRLEEKISSMYLVGQCMICGKPAFNSCAICGSLICDDHYYPRTKMCSRCISPIAEVDKQKRREQLDHYH